MRIKSLGLIILFSLLLSGCSLLRFGPPRTEVPTVPSNTASGSAGNGEVKKTDEDAKQANDPAEENGVAAIDRFSQGGALDKAAFTEKVSGSCNLIVKQGQCLDYLGSAWDKESIAKNCQASGATSSSPMACPQPSYGGCLYSDNTPAAQILWTYGNSAYFARSACEAENGAKWIEW